MKHLIEIVPQDKMLAGVTLGEMLEIYRALDSYLKDRESWEGATVAWVAAGAYALGIREGIHRERARRNGGKEPMISVKVFPLTAT